MKRTLIVGGLLIVAFGIWVLRVNNRPAPKLASIQMGDVAVGTSAPAVHAAVIEKSSSPSPKAGTLSAMASTNKTGQVARPAPAEPFAFQADLDRFHELKNHVLPNEDEKRERARMRQDAALLNSFRDLLKSAQTDAQTLKDQNLALDLLFDGLKANEPESLAVLQGVIQDAQIENPALPKEVRENLAGLKAEALFQWAAQQPTQAPQLQSWLPGPVSQKIWSNVVDRQKSNLAESAAEIAHK